MTGAETDQLSHMTTADRAICIRLPVSCLLRGIIWQSDKQRDRQTDKQSVGYSQSSHCQSHYHSVPVSGPTAKGQYLSRQSPSLPNIEQHAVAVCPPSDFWTHSLFFFSFLLLLLSVACCICFKRASCLQNLNERCFRNTLECKTLEIPADLMTNVLQHWCTAIFGETFPIHKWRLLCFSFERTWGGTKVPSKSMFKMWGRKEGTTRWRVYKLDIKREKKRRC